MDQFIRQAAEYEPRETAEVLGETIPFVLVGERLVLIVDNEVRFFQEVKRRAASLKDLIANAAKAATRTIGAAATGERVVAPPDIVETRRAKCAQCVHQKDGRCVDVVLPDGTVEKGCGCIIQAKTQLASEACPIGKW